MTSIDGKLLRYRDGPIYVGTRIICVQRRSFLANHFASAPPRKKEQKTPKGLNAVTVRGGGA